MRRMATWFSNELGMKYGEINWVNTKNLNILASDDGEDDDDDDDDDVNRLGKVSRIDCNSSLSLSLSLYTSLSVCIVGDRGQKISSSLTL